ncbi:MAG: hypothetical protein WDZ94_01150 [Patescibacteria group bacterium]
MSERCSQNEQLSQSRQSIQDGHLSQSEQFSQESADTGKMLHVDINSYFATLLQQETPALRGKPMVVVKDVGRSCVIAASKEAKKLGIQTGSLVGDAKLRCLQAGKQLQIAPAQFDVYWSATRDLYALLRSFSPDTELFSLDEAFIPHASIQRLYPDPEVLGRELQVRIKQTLGEWVTCNVGIGPNRFLAKMQSETAPKGSVTRVNWQTAPALLAQTPFDSVCGIGHRLEKRLARLGVRVPYQINFFEPELLESMFGPFWSRELQKMAVGQEPHFLTRSATPLPHMKSVGRSITGYELCWSAELVRATLYNLVSEVMYKVRRMQLGGRRVAVSLRGDGQRWGAHRTLQTEIRHTAAMFSVVQSLLEQRQQPFPVIKIAVSLSLLKPWQATQQPLLPQWHRQERIAQAIDSMADKHGLFTITSGRLLRKKIIMPEVTGFLGDKTFQFGA